MHNFSQSESSNSVFRFGENKPSEDGKRNDERTILSDDDDDDDDEQHQLERDIEDLNSFN